MILPFCTWHVLLQPLLCALCFMLPIKPPWTIDDSCFAYQCTHPNLPPISILYFQSTVYRPSTKPSNQELLYSRVSMNGRLRHLLLAATVTVTVYSQHSVCLSGPARVLRRVVFAFQRVFRLGSSFDIRLSENFVKGVGLLDSQESNTKYQKQSENS